ncbi:hypothetical protein ACP70R_049379 [Stipagrostis hirtigluma subsp. patula]
MSQASASSRGATRRGRGAASVPTAPAVGQSGLPLIQCPVCKKGDVIELICKKDGVNRCRRFFKCPRNISGVGCTFFKFENEYIVVLEEEGAEVTDEHDAELPVLRDATEELRKEMKSVVGDANEELRKEMKSVKKDMVSLKKHKDDKLRQSIASIASSGRTLLVMMAVNLFVCVVIAVVFIARKS